VLIAAPDHNLARVARAQYHAGMSDGKGLFRCILYGAPMWATLAGMQFAAARGDESQGVDFAAEIQPLLRQRCTSCHGGVKREGGLSFVDRRSALSEIDSGAHAIIPEKPEESELLRRVAAEDPDERMPPTGEPLNAEQIALLRRWISAGAEWPEHWSLAPLQRRPLPRVPEASWVRNPIDLFVLARLESEEVEPSPEADRSTLIRRLYLDLHGLPPSPPQVEAFLDDESPDAYERLVDRMLASPHFGERWGRHWLDPARYADTDGYEVDAVRPHAWRWRDWVIRAVNDDLPFDQFTVEQLAGDLLPEATLDQKLATAFHRNTLTNKEGGADQEEYRVYAVMDRVNTTATVWLGLTAACTQCHDHPYDPFSQREFYQLFAFFNNADETELPLPVSRDVKVPVLAERDEPRTTHLLRRGNFLAPENDEAILPATPAALPPLQPRCDDRLPDRLDLARWIVDPAHPLTARVAANDLWRHLFGEGLVRTPGDFGAQGEPPTHPELLDWLATEYMRLGWRRKTMVRLIVTSAAYRQSSRRRPELEVRDGENRLVARQNRFRIEAEVVRDLPLAASGLLARKIGGPSVFPPFPHDLTKIDFRSDLKWETSSGADRYRRGMYTFFKRTLPYPTLITFDCPDASVAAVRRPHSNTPLQALALLNNEVFVEAAQALGRSIAEGGLESDEARVEFAWRLCFSRPPGEFERRRMLQLHREHRRWYAEHPDDAALLAGETAADRSSASELAAWIATASAFFNLDEFITRE
jgi:hypothetical protein